MATVLLVDAADLIQWADRRDAQGVLPKLIRRLVLATGGNDVQVRFRADEGVNLCGWDGVVAAKNVSTFVPSGVSGWELSTTGRVKQKANENYCKRTKDPKGINPAEATFIFVTPRRWPRKEDWVRERKKENRWQDVRVYDADDLATWIEQAPAVHLWLSSLLGKHIEDAEDLESFWGNWRAATRPTIPRRFLLAGRKESARKIHEWLLTTSALLTLQADSQEEAIAFFAAAIYVLGSEERAATFSRTVIVRSEHVLHQLAAHDPPLTFVLSFESTTAAYHAIRRDHRVLVPVGREAVSGPDCITIPRLSVEEAAKELVCAGLSEDRVHELARLARRSVQAFRRELTLCRELHRPAWSDPCEGPALVPAMLAGTWRDGLDGDCDALGRLAGDAYERVRETVVRWANTSDPPVRCVSDTWYVVSREDAWAMLARYLDRDAFERFEDVAFLVLSNPDPKFDLQEDQRYLARLLGHAPRYSAVLCRGLAETLAVMATSAITPPLAGGSSASDVAASIVRKLLERANSDWRIWASLAEWGALPLLAEAAPDVFLEAVDNGLRAEEPVLLRLFAKDDAGLFTSSPHTGLLWALETVAWSPEHLGYASRLLAKLARLDPGGKLANRPQNSLRAIFLPWLPQTAASPEQRLRVFDTLRDREPQIAWKLMVQLLPQGHDVGHYTAKPRWREWHDGRGRKVPHAEYWWMIGELVSRLVQDAAQHGNRWKDLVDATQNLPPDLHRTVVDALDNLEAGALSEDDRAAIWNALRTLLSRHRSFPEANWALQADTLERFDRLMLRFEPASPQARYGWLFSECPMLLEGHQGDWRKQEEEVAKRRAEAAHMIHSAGGLEAVLGLAQYVDRPDALGEAFAKTAAGRIEEIEILDSHLASKQQQLAWFAQGFASGRIAVEGREWAEAKIREATTTWTSDQQAEFLICLSPDPRTWDLVDSLGPDTARSYWRRIRPIGIDEADVQRAAQTFLEHGSPRLAVALLARRRRSVPALLVAEALEGFVDTPPEDRSIDALLAYEIGELIDLLQSSPQIDRSRVARLEWALLPFLCPERQPQALHEELSRNPEFFVKLVELVYRAEGEEPRDISQEDRMRVQRASDLLDSWRSIPGDKGGSVVAAEELKKWRLFRVSGGDGLIRGACPTLLCGNRWHG